MKKYCRCGVEIYKNQHVLCTQCRIEEEEKAKIQKVAMSRNEDMGCPPHFWLLDSPQGGMVKQTCKKCTETKWVKERYWLDSDVNDSLFKKSA